MYHMNLTITYHVYVQDLDLKLCKIALIPLWGYG
jgi:hypothetical protein